MSRKRIFTKEETDLMIKMYNDGETYSVIGKELKTKDTTVSKYLKSLGYEKRPHNMLKNHDYLSASRKNKLNEHFFEVIDTESKAYWLGFLYADGYVAKKHDKNGNEKGGSVELALQNRDKYHIQNFLDDIESTAPIADKVVKLNNNQYLANRTCITSIKMVNDLIKNGCFENKSLTLKPPTTIPNDLIHHFIRGYFDGDGCVCFYPERYTYVYSIIGTKEFLEFIASEINLPSYTIISFKHKKCYELKTYSKESAKIFHNYIYKDKSIFLERKYQKSLGMMKWCEMEDSRNETQKMADLLGDTLIYDDSCMENFAAFYLKRSETAAMADLLD